MRVCDCFRSHQQVCLWLCESTGEDSCGYSMAKSVDSVLPKILRLLKSFFLGPVLSFSLFNPSGIMFSLSFIFQHFVFYFFTWLSEECDPLASPGRCSDAVFFVDGLIFYPSTFGSFFLVSWSSSVRIEQWSFRREWQFCYGKQKMGTLPTLNFNESLVYIVFVRFPCDLEPWQEYSWMYELSPSQKSAYWPECRT